MKRLLISLICVVALTIAAIPAGAQTRNRQYRNSSSAVQQQSRYNRNSYYDQDRDDYYDYGRNRSIWQKHRDKITTGGGALGGAVLGGMIGGKKGAIIGAIAGGAGAALYTYKIRKNDRSY